MPVTLKIFLKPSDSVVYLSLKYNEDEIFKLRLTTMETSLVTTEPGKYIKKLLELVNAFSKVAVYRINIQKYVSFLYGW